VARGHKHSWVLIHSDLAETSPPKRRFWSKLLQPIEFLLGALSGGDRQVLTSGHQNVSTEPRVFRCSECGRERWA
jgi:hypothetical protein